MSKPVSLCAALEIPKAADANGPMFLRAIADALSGHDGGASAVRISVKHCAVAAERLIVKVETSLSGADANRVSFRLAGRPGRPSPDPDDAVAVLSDIVTRALPLVDANHVEWVRPGVLLTPEEFLAAQSYISPKRARSVESGPKAEDDADRIDQLVSELVREETGHFGADAPVLPLENTFRSCDTMEKSCAASGPEPDDDVAPDQCTDRRAQAASWSFTTVTATISLPAALLLSALHALRGSDMRMSVHGLVLTGAGHALWQAGLLEPITRLAGF